MAQSWRRSGADGQRASAPPLDAAALERLALRYVERYATSRARLSSYLQRKLRERGWSGEETPPIAALVERMAALGYVDDEAFATARAASLVRRGYGPRRVSQSLHAAGIDAEDAASAKAQARHDAWAAALDFSRRRRIGPFASTLPDRDGRQKGLAALLRAGHDMAMARRLIDAEPGVIPDWDDR